MITKRILSILDEKSIRMSDLCKYLGINTSTMTNWKNRNTDPPAKYIIPICEFLNVDCEFLLSGTSHPKPSSRISKEDARWLELIHQLPAEAQYEFRGELKGYLRRLREESADTNKIMKKTGTEHMGK